MSLFKVPRQSIESHLLSVSMANESTNRSEERFWSCGGKRPLTAISESKSELSKKARGSGDSEVWLAANVKKVAEILLVLATMVEMRGGRKASSVEVEMMIEARRKLVEICEEFGPKDVFENDVFGIIVDDLGLGRMKETKLAACCPKMSIVDKLEATKMEKDEFYSPRTTEPRASSRGVRKSTSDAYMPKPDHKAWIVPSTSDCMKKVLTCQICECVINEMCSAVICDACESACHLRCFHIWRRLALFKVCGTQQWETFPLKYGRVVRIASKPEMSSSTARVQQSIEKKVQSSDGYNNQKKIPSVRDALLNPLSQNGIKLECNQEDDMREDKEDVEWVGDNFVKTSETCTVVKKNEGTVSSRMHDVEWVGDKLNEADGKTYYRS
nr:hypothetical protein [Tanacetum cinerariifolium]